MSWTLTYYSPTIPSDPGFSVALTTVRAEDIKGFVAEAELGAVGSGSVPVEDPSATVGNSGDAILGLKQLAFTESAAPVGRRRTWTGYIGDREYDRGRFTQAAERTITPTLVDLNSFLTFRKFKPVALDPTSSFDRPEESDIQRVLALLGVDFLSTTLFNGLVDTTGTGVPMDANDYAFSSPGDVLNDCAQASGRNYFVFYDEAGTYTVAAGRLGLFYAFNKTTAYRSAIRVSNVIADYDGSTTFFPMRDARLRRDPSRLVAGIIGRYSGGVAYRSRPATANTYGWRDAVIDMPHVHSLAKANARLDRYLEDNATEDDRITFSLTLNAANVNDWREGEAGQIKFTNLPGYGSGFTWARCLRRTVRSTIDEAPSRYIVDYEVTPAEPDASSCAVAFAAIVSEYATGSSYAAQGSAVTTTVSATPTAAVPTLLITFATARGGDTPEPHGATTPSGYTLVDSFDSDTGSPGGTNWAMRGVIPFLAACRQVAVPSGDYTATGTYVQGYAVRGSAWVAFQIALRTSATGAVQTFITTGTNVVPGTAYLSSSPTAGNFLLLVMSVQNVSSMTGPLESGWTLLESVHIEQPGDATRHRLVNVYCRCYAAGEGQTSDGTQWGVSGGSQHNLFWLSEWAIT